MCSKGSPVLSCRDLYCAFFLNLIAAFVVAEEPQLQPLKGSYASLIKDRRVYGNTLEEQLEQLADDPQLKRYKQRRAELANSPYQPIFHYTYVGGRLGDPDGLCYWNGNFHLFYQAHPDEYSVAHWGHAYSNDLVHWKDLPLAIYPDIEERSYSGNTLVEEDRVIAFYHGYEVGNMIATASDPLLLNWHKWPENPVIPGSPHKVIEGAATKVFDPFIWKEDNGYYSLSGTTRVLDDFPNAPERMAPELYYSQDLTTWKYLGCLLEEHERITPYGASSACPYFYPIGNPDGSTYILIFFDQSGMASYLLGYYDRIRSKFNPFHHGKFNAAGMVSSYHVASAMSDGNGGVYVICYVKRGLDGETWNQVMSLPLHLTLNQNKRLDIKPVKALEELRIEESLVEIDEMFLPANKALVLEEVRGNTIEILAEIDTKDAREIQMNVLRSGTKREYTSFRFIRDGGPRINKTNYSTIALDTAHASLHPDMFGRMPEMKPIMLEGSELLRIRIFVDKSVVEVFVNDRESLLLRACPTLPDSIGVSITALGRDATLKHLKKWNLSGIYANQQVSAR
ncbi:MAG: glycoside hydrolase family 32 protein [Pirellulales bacterium]|nr:glycoside hydrolase family 32 protein [Pirellulales bacterium]